MPSESPSTEESVHQRLDPLEKFNQYARNKVEKNAQKSWRHLGKPCDGILLYQAQAKANDHRINHNRKRCGALSLAATLEKNKYRQQFASYKATTATLEKQPTQYYRDRVSQAGGSYHIGSPSQLGQMLAKTLGTSPEVGTHKKFLLISEVHSMRLEVKIKETQGSPYIVLKFYEPNQSIIHRRCICANTEKLKKVEMTYFSTKKFLHKLFNHINAIALQDLDKIPTPTRGWHAEFSHEETESIFDTIDQLAMALEFGDTQFIERQMPVLLSKIHEKGVMPHLAKTYNGASFIARALWHPHSKKAAVCYIETIMQADIPSSDKVKLIIAPIQELYLKYTEEYQPTLPLLPGKITHADISILGIKHQCYTPLSLSGLWHRTERKVLTDRMKNCFFDPVFRRQKAQAILIQMRKLAERADHRALVTDTEALIAQCKKTETHSSTARPSP